MNKSFPIDMASAARPGFFRRLGAMLYDLLLLVALMFVATALITLPFGNATGNWLILFQFFIFEIIPLVFFTGFWKWGGQTLGMRAWRIKLIRSDGLNPQWGDVLKRHFAALLSLLSFGLGFLWILNDKDKLAWHDHLSKTCLIMVKR